MQLKLSDYQKQKKYVVLFFYPLDFTFVCPTGKVPSKWAMIVMFCDEDLVIQKFVNRIE